MGWDDNGLPTERRVAELLRRPLRPVAALRPRLRRRPSNAGQAGRPRSISRRNFVELCERLTAEDEKAFEDLWRALGLSVDWDADLHHHRRPLAAGSPSGRSCATSPGARPTRPRRPVLWDVDFRSAVAQAELEDRETPGRLPPHRVPPARRRRAGRHRDHPARADRGLRRPRRPPRRRALPAAVRHDRPHAAVRRRGRRSRAHPLADPEKGTGIAMICTFGDITDVIWWRELQLPTRVGRRRERPPRCRGARRGSSRRRGAAAPTPSWPARPSSRPSAASSSCSRESGELDGEPRADHPPGEVLREGRPAARDRHQPPVVHPQRRPRRRAARRAAATGATSCTGTRRTCGSATRTGSTASTATGSISPPALLRRAVPGLVPARRRRRARLRRSRSSPTRPRCPSTRPATCPPATTSPSAASPAASSATPTSWTPGPPRRSPRRSPAAGSDDPDLFARTFPMDLRPQAHEIIRTWLFSTVVRVALRARHAAVDQRRASRAGSSTPTARRCRSRRATSSRRSTMLEQYGADAVRYWAASGRPGTDTAFDEGQMKVGRRLAIKMLNAVKLRARARATTVRPRTDPPPSPSRSTGRCSPRWPTWSTRPPPPSTATTTPGPSSAPRRSSGRSATTTSSWSRAGPTARRAPRRRRRPRPRCSSRSSTLLRLFAPFLPFVTEEVWSWWQDGLGPPRAVARRRRRCATLAGDGDPLVVRRGRRGARRGPQGQDRGQALAARAGRPVVVDRPRAARARPSQSVADDVREASNAAELAIEVGAEPSITVELAPEPDEPPEA